jgi:apolipoprotein D and lipocalin family protein
MLSALLVGCTSVPEGIKPVSGFDLQRYLGTWYEIARLDHPFERGLNNITAEYSLRDDGGVNVLNSGFDIEEGEWQEAQGKAYFVESSDTGHLKVSFFGPFYASYVVFELDQEGYQYAMVTGPDREYLWILSRQPTLPDALLNRLLDKARGLGYAVGELIYVEHDRNR